MINVTYVTENGGSVVFNEEDGVSARYGGEPNVLGEYPEDFYATVRLEDGQSIRIFIRRGLKGHKEIEPIMTVKLCEPGNISGPEIFRRWFRQNDEVIGNS